MNVGAVHRFHQSQRRLLEQTYDLAWQQGVHSYEPDEDPDTQAEEAEEDPGSEEALEQGSAAPGVTRERERLREEKYRPPTSPDEEARAKALGPAMGGVQSMVGELLTLSPTSDHIDDAMAAAQLGEIAPEEAEAHAERIAVNEWIDSNAWRLDAGESVAWAGEQQGYAQAAEADGQLIEWLTEADGHVCEDCEALGGLPPMPLGDWPTRPGDGDTVCNVGCRCVLQVADEQTLVDLNPRQEELISDLASRREPSDWEHALPAPPPETRTPPPPPPPASPAVEHVPGAPAEINTAPEASAYLQSIGYDNIPINWGEKLGGGSAEATDALREVSTALRDARDALGQRASQLDGIWADSEAAKAGLPHSPMKESTWAQVLTRQGSDPTHRPRTSDLVLNDRSLPWLRERWVDGSVQDTGHNAIATRDLYGRTLHEMGHTFMNNAPNAVPQVNRLLLESDFRARIAESPGMTPSLEPWNLPYISNYAMKDTQEAFAEIFATLMRPGGVEDAVARTERLSGPQAADALRSSLLKFREGLNELHRNSPTVWPHIPTRDQDALDKLAELAKERTAPDRLQALGDPAKLWEQAAEVKPVFDSILTDAGASIGGKVLVKAEVTPASNGVLLAPLKAKDGRGLEKVRAKYAGDFTRLKDIVRGTVVVPNEEDLPEALDAVARTAEAKGWKVTGIENRFAREPGSKVNLGPTKAGYRDLALHLVSPDGHVTEVQINTAPLLVAKNNRGHDIYDSFRAIDEKPAEARTAAEQATWERGMRESRSLYDVAEAQSRPISYLNITPFTGKEPEAGFYDSARWHSFQSDLERVAKEEHVTIEGIDHVRGIWKGGGEPAARVILTDGIEGVRGVADRLGAAYDQEAVLRFRRDDIRGRSYRYVSDQPITQEALDKAMLDSKLPGATLLPDGRVEVIDIGNQQALDVSKLRSDLGVTFSYTRGDAELRADGKDYQRGAKLDRRAPASDAGLPPAQPGEGPVADHVDRGVRADGPTARTEIRTPPAAQVRRALVDAPKNPAPPAIVKGYMGQARREGFKLGTPEYAKRVAELAAQDGHDSVVLPEKEGRLALKLLDPDKLSEFEKALQLLEPLPSEGEPYG